jgi:phosphate transport system permease protein
MDDKRQREQQASPGQPGPGRFGVDRATLRVDALMRRVIPLGGLGVVLAICGIFLFILAEVIPLFTGARIHYEEALATGHGDALLIGMDEWAERPFIADPAGTLHFLDRAGGGPPQAAPAPLPDGARVTAAAYLQREQVVAFGLSDGRYLLGRVRYAPDFTAGGARTIGAQVAWEAPAPLAAAGGALTDLDGYVSDTRQTFAGISEADGEPAVEVVSFSRRRSLFGDPAFLLDHRADLTRRVAGRPVQVLVGANAESVVVRNAAGEVFYFHWEDRDWGLRQRFMPFAGSGEAVASMGFIHGRVSLSLTSTAGRHHIHSLYHTEAAGERRFGPARECRDFAGGAALSAASTRNKALLLARGQRLSLRHATTAAERWAGELPFTPRRLLIGGKFDTVLGLDAQGTLHFLSLRDPHPEAGFKAFFGKIQYEGQDSPRYTWQSTGGTDDFEPKLSMVPLLVGSLKGTFYALLFAIPIALLAAIHTSQFLAPGLRRFIKPGIEIMASLPSVVLGFLAALWLAPILVDRVPSVILVLLAIPLSAILAGHLWNRMPVRLRHIIPDGWELLLFLPVISFAAMLAWQLGPYLESVAFRYTDPATGEAIADFRLWWEAVSGRQFQQRNALVVGIMMGFAVIPIIYTLAEDALSSVPASMVSGSLALGASRWQTTARIVLPTASAGIFSAVMIGFGRAVGETMIVVMATGNTPIMDFDLFSGMRTLSANIAVELPEAPHHGTLYRALFLGAFLLFILTFVVNTVAEVLRERLRQRYKVVH